MSASPPPEWAPATVPAEPFEAPLIRTASAPRRFALARDAVLTTLLWLGWSYMLAAAVGVFWIPPFVDRLLPVRAPDASVAMIVIVLICLAGALVIAAATLVRALRDRIRFAGADRRRDTPDPTDPELAEALGAEGIDLAALRAARRAVLHHGPDGGVVRAEL